MTAFSKKLDIIFAKTIIEIANSRGKPSRVISFQGNHLISKLIEFIKFTLPPAKIQNFELFCVDFKIVSKLCLVESFTKFGF